MVDAVPAEAVSDGPDREVYSITDKGRAKLGAMCACDTYKKEPRP